MASVNKVLIIGTLGKDPEVRFMPNGDAVANYTIATNETWKDKATGEKKEKAEWHRIVSYGKQAEIAGEYLKKGSSVYVEGKLQTRKWQNKEGVDQYTTEIVADRMQMLGGKSSNDAGVHEPRTGGKDGQSGPAPKSFDDLDDDIPFIADANLFEFQSRTEKKMSKLGR